MYKERLMSMSKIVVSKTTELKGAVKISGSKNAVLPLIAASLLTSKECTLRQTPQLNDVQIMCNLLQCLGGETRKLPEEGVLWIRTENADGVTAPYDLVNKLRASVLIMGPLLARFGFARLPLPGGCAIGTRPIDLHLKGFAAMGVSIHQEHGFVEGRVRGKLRGARIYLDFPSVGATENIMMAAALAEGETIIENAATEPEIVDLATCLNSMGANVKRAGTDTIRIEGVDELNGYSHTVIPDRIEAGTFMISTVSTGGEVLLENVLTDHLKPISAKLKEAGASIIEKGDSIKLESYGRPRAFDLKTLPYPGFPTDLQAQMGSLLSIAEGTSVVIETIFENRFMHFNELARMGANIKTEGRTAIIEGVHKLTGSTVKATDLRAGAGLLIAGMIAEGETEITHIDHIERGYEAIVEKYKKLGANIFKVDGVDG